MSIDHRGMMLSSLLRVLCLTAVLLGVAQGQLGGNAADTGAMTQAGLQMLTCISTDSEIKMQLTAACHAVVQQIPSLVAGAVLALRF